MWYVSLKNNETGVFKLHFVSVPQDKAEVIILGKTYAYKTATAYQYIPTKTGFYRLYFNENQLDYFSGEKKVLEVYDSHGDRQLYIDTLIPPTSESEFDYVYRGYYLEKGETYVFRAENGYVEFNLKKEKEYKKSEPITISENCRLYTYSVIDGVQSEIGVYRYKIDKTPVEKPIMNGYWSSYAGKEFVEITCDEGDIYYKTMFGTDQYKKYTVGKSIEVPLGGVLVAYAKIGNVKSKIKVY